MDFEQLQQQSLEYYIKKYLLEIPDFTIIPHYNSSTKLQPNNQPFRYQMLFNGNSDITRIYKTSCKIKFQCENKGHQDWKTSLGMIDIFYRISARQKKKISESKSRGIESPPQQIQKHHHKESKKTRDRIRQLIYMLQAKTESNIVYYQMRTNYYKDVKFQVDFLIKYYQIHVDYNYYIYKQECKTCNKNFKKCTGCENFKRCKNFKKCKKPETYGRPILYESENIRISKNVANYIEKILSGVIFQKIKGTYRLKNHLVQLCQACQTGKCFYQKNEDEDENENEQKQKQKQIKTFNFFIEQDQTILLFYKFKQELDQLVDMININQEQSVLQMQKSTEKMYPFTIMSNVFHQKLKGKTGRLFFNLIYYYKFEYLRMTKQQRVQNFEKYEILRQREKLIIKNQQIFQDEDEENQCSENLSLFSDSVCQDSDEEQFSHYDTQYVYARE